MKARMVVTTVMVTILLATGACSLASGASIPKEASIEVPIDEFSETKHITKEIEVPDGGILTVTLGSNPTTGFSWGEAAHIEDAPILQQIDSELLLPEGEGQVGVPGQQVWAFKALQKGNTTINMEYSRPWEGGEKAEWTFELIVTVR
jgi:inhibitor of cysteine peptidase